jgi:hypothetical protein
MPNTYMPMNTYQQPWQPAGQDGAINYGGDINQQGATSDPFAYTQGSLLTPWEGRFESGGYGISTPTYQAPAWSPFNYADINYAAPDVGQFKEVYQDPQKFGETYQDPAAFRFADFAGPSDFRAPTAEDMQADPGYQARMAAVKNAQVAGAAHGGVLRSGAFQKGLARAVGDQASQEYGNVYGRRAGEHDRLRAEAQSNYGINQGNTFQAFNTNVANRLMGYKTREGAYQQDIENKLRGYQTRQGTWQGNADVGLRQGELGYNIATGTWDRNFGKARQGWEDQQAQNERLAQIANQNAAAGAAGSNAAYARDLADYTRARDEFWTNQDRQYGILDREATRGQNAATTYGNQMMGGYGAMGDYAMGGANARASGTMGSGNAWGGFAGDVGNTMGGLMMYGSMYGAQPTTTTQSSIRTGNTLQPMTGSRGAPSLAYQPLPRANVNYNYSDQYYGG